MYYPKDPLYLPDNPDMTPCRWNVNIRDCRASPVYVVGYYIIAVACGLGLLLNIMLFMRNSFYMHFLRPSSRWPPLLSLSLAYAGAVIFQGMHAILLLVDVNSPCWVRELVRSLSVPLMFIGLRPYISGLVTMAGSIDFDTVHLGLSQRSVQRLLYIIPYICYLAGTMAVLGAVGLDHGNNTWYKVCCILNGVLYVYPSLMVSLCCYEYGVCFADVVDTELQEARQNPEHPWNTTRLAGSSQGTLDGSGTEGSEVRERPINKRQSPYAVEVAKALNGMRTVHRVALFGGIASGIQNLVINAMTNTAFSLLVFGAITVYSFEVMVSLYTFFIIALVLMLDIQKEGLIRSRRTDIKPYGADDGYYQGTPSMRTGISNQSKLDSEEALETGTYSTMPHHPPRASFSARDGLIDYGIRGGGIGFGGGTMRMDGTGGGAGGGGSSGGGVW
ncbi:MAG: hypothetical protein DHS80DRAFT_33102 [Piptocephalis tieghemiana]|nr:MAG: hypothetical protein DHS80DRAFT_33102 [Piptocephalis tieghemiana]